MYSESEAEGPVFWVVGHVLSLDSVWCRCERLK